ncbi:MAG: exodeoxyribonuclease V subunit gamma [Verrucomicrobiae bacterium]
MMEAAGGLMRTDSPVLQPVVIPSLSFADHLQRRMADRFGICMGLEFLMPQDFIHRAVGPGADSPWSKRQLLWKVLPHVADYAEHLGMKSSSPRDRFALAGLLADRLDQYGHFRPEMIRRWANLPAKGRKLPPLEDWQRELWRKLQAEISTAHPALEMARLGKDAEIRKRLASQFPKLLILGTGTLDPLLIEVLGLLAEGGAEVRLDMLLPSLGFLGDLHHREALPSVETDPEEMDIPGSHPLVESMGRHAVGSFLLLGKLDENYDSWPEPSAPEDSSSLLAALQSDIRRLRAPKPVAGSSRDGSLRVHACYGPRREMEVVRDEILRAFEELPGLKPEEIHIVAAELDCYAPLVPAVLGQGSPILPVQLSEGTPSSNKPASEGILALLTMAHGGRFEAAEVLALLRLPAVQAALGCTDAEKVRRWVKESGWTHGLADLPGGAGFATNRLIAGRWFGPEVQAAQYPDGSYVLPVADEMGGSLELRARLHDWLAAMAAAMLAWQTAVPAAEWGQRLIEAASNLLSAEEDIQPLLVFLRDQPCPEPLDAGAVLDWLTRECQEGARRARVTGRIAFGRFKQLQNLPCRVLVMVGMENSKFPSRSRIPSWDLLRTSPRIWDRNPRLDDRQLFLDALLTPKDRLIITAGTRNPRSNKSEPFSSCVDELLRTAAAMGAANLITQHRLQPFVEAYFQEDAKLPQSYDPLCAGVARNLRRSALSGEAAENPFWNGEPHREADKTRILSIPALVRFWKSPADAFVKSSGIRFPWEEPADEEFNRPPLEVGGLQLWCLKDGILHEVLAPAPNLPWRQAKAMADRELPPGQIGGAAWSQEVALVEPLGLSVKGQIGETMAFEWGAELSLTGELTQTADGKGWLVYRTGEMKAARHFLEPWIASLLASACGDVRPTRLFDEARPEAPTVLEPIPTEEARKALSVLVEGFCLGQTRPLCFGLATSDLLAAEKIKSGSEEMALAKASAAWLREDYGEGEGMAEAARLAWRDRNPFAEPEEWHRWADGVSRPLRSWGGFP